MVGKLIGNVKGIFNISTLIDMGMSLLYLIFGIIFLAIPNLNNSVVSIIIGIFLIINGVSHIYIYLKKDNVVLLKYVLHYGIAIIIVGILMVFLRNILSILLGFYLIILAIQKGIYGICLKNLNESSWLIITCIGVMFLIIAIISFFTGGSGLVQASGIIFMGIGLINLIGNLILRRRSEYFLVSKTDV